MASKQDELEDRILGSQKLADLALKLFVNSLSAANKTFQTTGRSPTGPGIFWLLLRLQDDPIAEIVIGAHVQNLAAAYIDAGILRAIYHALGFVKPGGAYLVQGAL